MPRPARNAASLKSHLSRCGYDAARLAESYSFDGHVVALAGFACKPWDTRTACVAAVDADGDSKGAAEQCSNLGAPAVFVCHSEGVDWWKMGATGPTERRGFGWGEVSRVFDDHRAELRPKRIYEAKLRRGRSADGQMWFFDVGLMPAVERNIGQALLRVVEETIGNLRREVGSLIRRRQDEEDVYRTVFWFLAAKVLHDKGVPNFIRIDLTNPDEVFDRIGKHHGERDRLPPFGRQGRSAIEAAAREIAKRGSFANVSSESLAFVYENALIDPNADRKRKSKKADSIDIRRELGIHSTPSVLVDHMLAQLWPMIEEIPEEKRRVFEPACGHAPFLVASLRWLRDFTDESDPDARHRYLRQHLHGIEADPFAVEVARLSLLLADAPHGNKWEISVGDMLAPRVLASHARMAGILVANPPYEAFKLDQKKRYKRLGEPITALTKGVEVLQRTLPNLRAGSAFGVVMPQGVLHDRESRRVREFVLANCDLAEIAVFGDNLFEHGDQEVTVLMGRRRKPGTRPVTLWYRRVRERGMAAFKDRLAFSTEREVGQERFTKRPDAILLLPDLLEVWDYLRGTPLLHRVADIQQGFQFLNEEKLKGREVVSKTKRAGWVRALLRASDDYDIWRLPKPVWIDAAPGNFRRPGAASRLGVAQIVLNYAPVAREPWRLKAVVDDTGIAVSSRFLVFRRKRGGPSLRVLWAVLNSPVANGYAYCFSGKRETLVKEWRAFPVPTITAERALAIENAAAGYIAAVDAAETAFMQPDSNETVRRALLAMDAEVLRLYDLPPQLEWNLLDRFAGVERKGVGCVFGDYYPAEFKPCIPLHEYISEDYKRSTAGEIVKRLKPVRSKAAIAALDRTEFVVAEE